MSDFINRIAVVLRDEIMRQAPDLALTSIEIDCTVLAERIAEALHLTDAEAIAGDIEFCMEAGHPDTARKQLGRLISLLSGWTTAEDHR